MGPEKSHLPNMLDSSSNQDDALLDHAPLDTQHSQAEPGLSQILSDEVKKIPEHDEVTEEEGNLGLEIYTETVAGVERTYCRDDLNTYWKSNGRTSGETQNISLGAPKLFNQWYAKLSIENRDAFKARSQNVIQEIGVENRGLWVKDTAHLSWQRGSSVAFRLLLKADSTLKCVRCRFPKVCLKRNN